MGVQVSWGAPYPVFAEAELVILGTVAPDPSQEPVGLGLGRGITEREEKYHIDVTVSVLGAPQIAQQTLAVRAFVIADVVEASIVAWAAESATFGDAIGGGWATFGGWSETEAIHIGEKKTAREAAVTASLDVTARRTAGSTIPGFKAALLSRLTTALAST